MNVRNVAIIAHVDHGKTTLVDALLRQSKTSLGKEQNEQGLIMDSDDLERERGITIFSKNAAIVWEDTKINIIDTPGHADFGGEVERVLNMADGCLLLVDAKEGPMPQTRFVLKKALAMGLRVIVVINKIDKPDARPNFVLDKTFDLFVDLGANDATLNFPIIYASGKQGLAGLAPVLDQMQGITPIFESILQFIPAPESNEDKPLQFLVTNVTYDNYKGRIAIGRIHHGKIKVNQKVMHINRAGTMNKCQITSLMTFFGLERIEIDEVSAGDIVAIGGISDINIGETIADIDSPVALPLLHIEEPTVKMVFMVNDSPFAGREGEYSTSRQIQERLYRELETDMALKVENNTAGTWTISGRGELHLAILIERIRREGFEFQVSRPQVINKTVNDKVLTPYEKLYIEVPDEYSGSVIQALGSRKGELIEMRKMEKIAYLEFIIPTRCLFGYRSEFLNSSRGLGIINSEFFKYDKDPGDWEERDHGSLVAHETGVTHLYGLVNVQDRGVLFVKPNINVYEGQVVGQNTRPGDMRVNVCKEKHLSNMRSKGEGGAEAYNKYREMDLEDALEYIGDDELVEVTPKNVRIRKIVLNEAMARRAAGNK